MYYGMICRDGPVCLVKVTGNLNAMGYEDILFDNLVPFLEQHGHSDYIYQQDNAPIHTANRLREFFFREGIQVLKWPAKSPDLNPIENLWGLMKVWIQKKGPKNLVELDKFVFEAFNELCTKEYCESLYNSVPKRLPMVIENLGFRIKK